MKPSDSIMILRRATVPLIFTVCILFSSKAHSSQYCNRTCGNGRHERRLNSPFGFSDGCHIRLNCSQNGEFQIGDFEVQNVTAEKILISLPAQCNRSTERIRTLFGNNYALTTKNSLLLQQCKSSIGGCIISASTVDRLKLSGCETNRDNLSCYSEDTGGLDVLSYDQVKRTNCSSLFSAIAVDAGKNTVALDFQVVELSWWLNGPCNCSANSTCTKVNLPGGKSGYRCQCLGGFVGDGLRGGDGCRKASHCNASKYMSGRCGGTTRVGVLIGGIIAGASLVAILTLVCCCFIRRRSSYLKTRSTKRLLCEATGNSTVPFYPYREIERATNGFSERQRLGTGAYGTVYAGKLHNDDWVAIKKIKNRDNDSIESVMNEIKLISSVSHPNLVRLLGCCIEKGEQILVYEFMPNGTLSQHLQRERGKGLPWTIRLTIADETAHAIAHLHSAMNPPIYHRDIKSSNILLNYNYNSKVADFGLSRFGMTEYSHISTAPQGTPGYLDPQYHQTFHLSDKSDVYSFGVVLVEIITAMKVVDFSRPQSEVNLAALAIDRIRKGCVDDIVDPFIDPHRDAWTLASVHKVAELAFRCLAFHRDMRPSMMEVADELELIRLSGWASMDDNVCMASSSVASSYSSPYNGSEKSMVGVSKKGGVGSRTVVVPGRINSIGEVKDSSPVSIQDPWLSEESSPSTNSLLSNVVQ